MAADKHYGAELDRRLERLGLATSPGQWTERYLLCEQLVDPVAADKRQQFEATAHFVRDLVAHRWMMTRRARERDDPKRIYYISMEFLLGRTLRNNIMNLKAEPLIQNTIQQQGWNLDVLEDEEPDAGLGNGGLGRLAACFIDSLATHDYPAIGYGLRYEYGIFRQAIEDNSQVEQPDTWLHATDPWEVRRPHKQYIVPLNATIELRDSRVVFTHNKPSSILGIAYDRPVVGYGAQCINTLRLWSAVAPHSFNFSEFSHGDFAGSVLEGVAAESITRVLYPDDSTEAGRVLRFLQQYFMVSCSLQDIVARFSIRHPGDWSSLPDHIAIQMNDTHPALCVAELMRILLDQAKLDWVDAWDLTQRSLAYTNHTLLPEALEKWPVDLVETLIPRHLEIIYEINRRFLDTVRARYPGDEDRLGRMSLIEEGQVRRVRMAYLAVVGSHSVNGVAEIHSELLRTKVLRDFAEFVPERFTNKTNGVTPRRWLQQANPGLAGLITRAIGATWITDLAQLRNLLPYRLDAAFRAEFRAAKRDAKIRFTQWLRSNSGEIIDPESIFDSQIKRIHEYKRQLLNILHVIMLYNRLRLNPHYPMQPHTFFFAGKAAPAYTFAKLVIRLINQVAGTVNNDPVTGGRLKVLFLPEYNVTLAERLIPASDVSEQISTAGYEASGTGNMKFMMNGALTIGTRDGATIEMAREAGEDNFFLFGSTAQQIADSRGDYHPRDVFDREPEIRDALDLIASNHFSQYEPGIFAPVCQSLLDGGDHYFHLADLISYAAAHDRLDSTYKDTEAWTDKAIVNVACSGLFSSDRTIHEYAADIWNLKASVV